jgi:hypothetical protein
MEMDMAEVLTVLTYKGADHIVSDGGTESWVLNRGRVLACDHVVCARHRHGPWKPEGPEAHKYAFLVGKIARVEPSSETGGRWRVEFDEYALVDGPKLPLRSASPTQYFKSLAALGIDEGALTWRPVSSKAASARAISRTIFHEDAAEMPASFGEKPVDILMSAKAMVAARMGVAPEAVEISVRF